MPVAVKLICVGSSLGIVLPPEMLNHLHVREGDTLYLSESPDGLRLLPNDRESAATSDAFDEIMRENRDILRALAK